MSEIQDNKQDTSAVKSDSREISTTKSQEATTGLENFSISVPAPELKRHEKSKNLIDQAEALNAEVNGSFTEHEKKIKSSIEKITTPSWFKPEKVVLPSSKKLIELSTGISNNSPKVSLTYTPAKFAFLFRASTAATLLARIDSDGKFYKLQEVEISKPAQSHLGDHYEATLNTISSYYESIVSEIAQLVSTRENHSAEQTNLDGFKSELVQRISRELGLFDMQDRLTAQKLKQSTEERIHDLKTTFDIKLQVLGASIHDLKNTLLAEKKALGDNPDFSEDIIAAKNLILANLNEKYSNDQIIAKLEEYKAELKIEINELEQQKAEMTDEAKSQIQLFQLYNSINIALESFEKNFQKSKKLTEITKEIHDQLEEYPNKFSFIQIDELIMSIASSLKPNRFNGALQREDMKNFSDALKIIISNLVPASFDQFLIILGQMGTMYSSEMLISIRQLLPYSDGLELAEDQDLDIIGDEDSGIVHLGDDEEFALNLTDDSGLSLTDDSGLKLADDLDPNLSDLNLSSSSGLDLSSSSDLDLPSDSDLPLD